MASGIYGLSGSGMDIDDLVKGMMKTQQARYDKLYKQKTVETWRKESYNTLYKSIYNFRYNTLANYKTQANMSAKTASTTDSSTVTAKALGDAVQMTHDITVKKLASNAYLQSAEKIKRENTADPKSVKLSDIAGISESELKNGGDKIALAFSVDDGVNGKKYVSYTYDELAQGTTLNDLVSDMNKLGSNIQASYDNNNDSFALYNKIGGGTNTISISLESSVSVIDDKGAETIIPVDNAAVKRSTNLVNNLYLASYNSADKTMGTANKFSDDVKYSIGVAGKSGSFDFSGDKATLADMVGMNIEVPTDPDGQWYIINDDGTKTEINKDDEGFKIQVNGQAVSFTYEDLTKDLSESGNPIETKFAAVGVTVSLSAAGSKMQVALTRGNGEEINLEAAAGTSGEKFINKMNLSTNSLTSTMSGLDATTVKALAGNPVMQDGETEDSTAFELVVNGSKVSFSYKDIETMTMDGFAQKINDSSNGAKATFADGKLSIYNEDGSEFSISSGSQAGKTFLNALKLSSDDGTTIQEITGGDNSFSVKGESAEAIIDGKTYTSDSNTITTGSVVYTLNKVSKNNGTEDKPDYETTKVTINSDNATVVKSVKQFVEDYNKLIDELNTQIYAKYESTYLPLTDDEKSAMSEEQIKKWEEKAKTGLLSGDAVLKEAVNSMRSALASIISGTGNEYNSLASIGITTTDYTEHGKIELDEDKLNKALTADPDAAYKLFSTLSDTSSEKGIAHKLSDAMNTSLNKIKKKAGTTAELGDQSYVDSKITRLNTQMTTLKARMEKQQSSLYKKFNAMEAAIAQLNQQASYVTSAFGSSS